MDHIPLLCLLVVLSSEHLFGTQNKTTTHKLIQNQCGSWC